jgi:hypothetical protein
MVGRAMKGADNEMPRKWLTEHDDDELYLKD